MGPGETRVGLDAIADNDVVGIEGVPIEMDGQPLVGLADDDGLHARADRTAHGLLSDSVGCQYVKLPFGCSATMASHGRHKERLSLEPAEMVDGGTEDCGDVRHPTTTGSNRNRLARRHSLGQIEAGELTFNLRRYVTDALG